MAYIQTKNKTISRAEDISYSNTISGLTADDVQEAIDELVDEKVDKVSGKQLSTEDYTTAEKTKLEGIEAGADVNIIESISVNGTALSPDVDKNVDITVPTEAEDISYDNTVSELEADDVQEAIDKLYSKSNESGEKIGSIQETIGNLNSKSITALGDVDVLPLAERGDSVWQPRTDENRVSAGDFADNWAGGYIFNGSQRDIMNKPFDKIKVMVCRPGWVRIGIVRGTSNDQYDGVVRGIFKIDPYYDNTDVYPVNLLPGNDGSDTTADGESHTTLKKWLVVQWVATPGLHEFDIPETVITSPFEYVFGECRSGVSGFAMNLTGAAITNGDITIADGLVCNGTTIPTKYISTTYFGQNSYAMSNNMLDASATYLYSSNSSNGKYYNNWCTIDHNVPAYVEAGAVPSLPKCSTGCLNLGLYKKGDQSLKVFEPMIENCFSTATRWLGSATPNDCLGAYFPDGQDVLEGKEVYAIDIFVSTPGDITVYLMTSKDPTTNYVKRCFTLRTRAIGPQRIHLPDTIVMQKGEYLAFGGITEAAFQYRGNVADIIDANGKLIKGYADDGSWLFATTQFSVSNYVCKGDDPTGVQTASEPYDPLLNSTSIWRFGYWSGVRLTGDERALDFTNATLDLNDNRKYLNIGLVVREGKISKVEDLNISVTGDSISTYAGIVSKANDFGAVTNAAGDNAIYYPNNGKGETNGVDQTWWGKFIKDNRARLLRNDAWSGSQVGGTDSSTNSTACASLIRTKMLHTTQPGYVANTTEGCGYPFGRPDVILCCIGTNDLSGNRAVGAYSNTEPTDISTILGAFEMMVARHKTNYPDAKCVYFLLPRGNTQPWPYTNSLGLSISQLALSMEYIAKAFGAYFMPLEYISNLLTHNDGGATVNFTSTSGYVSPRVESTTYGVTDRLHPSATGHAMIANALTRFIDEKF